MTKGKALSTRTSTSEESAFEGLKYLLASKTNSRIRTFVNGKQFSNNANKIQT